LCGQRVAKAATEKEEEKEVALQRESRRNPGAVRKSHNPKPQDFVKANPATC